MTTDDRLVSGASSESSLPPNKSSGDIGELKPCPFCQSEGHTLLRGFRYADECPDRKELAVMCPTCEARAPLKAWNTRTPDPESAAEIERLRRERDEARTIVVEANNSLYGSQGYFHSTNGGPFDKYHLARPIEELKSRARDALTAESAVAAAWEEAARVAKDRWREWRSSYEDDLDGMDACEDISKAISARASAIRAAVSKKTAESGHSPSTHNSASE